MSARPSFTRSAPSDARPAHVLEPLNGRCARCGLACYRSNLTGHYVDDISATAPCPEWRTRVEGENVPYPWTARHLPDLTWQTWGPGIGWRYSLAEVCEAFAAFFPSTH